MKRKTYEVNKLKQEANRILARDNISQQEKKAICLFLEKILFETGNYDGYNFIYWLKQGYEEWCKAGKPKDNSDYLGLEYDRFYY